MDAVNTSHPKITAASALDAVIALLAISPALLSLSDSTRAISAPLATWLIFGSPLVTVRWALNPRYGTSRVVALSMAFVLACVTFSPTGEMSVAAYLILNGLIITLIRRCSPRPAGISQETSKDAERDVTGLIMPAAFEAEVAHFAAIADRYQLPFSIIACALHVPPGADHPKAEDTESLKNFAWALSDQLRLADTLCRWEAWKFVILLPYTTKARATEVVHKLESVGNASLQASHPGLRCVCGVHEHHAGDDPMLTFSGAEEALAASFLAKSSH